MSAEAPPTLQELARRSLLRNQAVAIRGLDDLPVHLFLELFTAAFVGRYTKILRAMVRAWPFPCLPLGSLMKTPNVWTLQFALDGLDMLLARKVRPRRWKLQVLDLREVHQDVWTMGYRAMARACSLEATSEMEHGPETGAKQPLRIFVDFWLLQHGPDRFQVFLLQWAKKRRDFMQLCCKKLQIFARSMYKIRKILHVVRLDCIQELHVHSSWHRDTMKKFVPYVSKMSNLRLLCFGVMSVFSYTSKSRNWWYSQKYAVHLRKLDSLRDLYINDVFFLCGTLHKILRSRTPLQSFSVTSSPLTESDVRHLARCASTSQLKHLALRDICMGDVSPGPLRDLLGKVAGTLETLILEDCTIRDSHITAILPALSRCSQLTTFSCSGNHISFSVLETLLRHTARLSHLRQGCYPVPSESYGPEHVDDIDQERFAQVFPKMLQILRDIRPPHQVDFGILKYFFEEDKFYRLEPRSNSNWVVIDEDGTPP